MTAERLSASRERHGRMLIVGDDGSLASSLPESHADRVQFCTSMFDAVGRVGQSAAGQIVESVVVVKGATQRTPQVLVRAIHTVDPSVAVYLVVDAFDQSMIAKAMDAGVERVLQAPLTFATVSELLDERGAVDRDPMHGGPQTIDAHVADEKHGTPHADGDVETPTLSVTEGPERRHSVDTADLILPLEMTGRTLGDSDLVDALVDDADIFLPMALALIVQETGWSDLCLLRGSTDDDSRGVPIRRASERFGTLSSLVAESKSLEPWADWLAGWMRLSKTLRDAEHDAMRDPLTGAWNRRYFDTFLPQQIDRARHERRPLAIVVFDVDDLKVYNDRYGHDAGDEILTEVVRLIRSMVRKGDAVCRIGGDEFAVVFADPDPPRKPGSVPIESIEMVVRRFQRGICALGFPALAADAPGTLSISAGMATYPWDGHDAQTLLKTADQLALASKRRGKNRLTIGRGAEAYCQTPDSREHRP